MRAASLFVHLLDEKGFPVIISLDFGKFWTIISLDFGRFGYFCDYEKAFRAVVATVGRCRQVPLVGADGGVGMLFAVSRDREQQYSTSGAP